MSKKLPCFVMATCLSALFCLGTISHAGEFDKGKTLYNEKCMICHGVNGEGNGPAAMALSKPPKDFSLPEFWEQKDVDQRITHQVKNGKGQMPAFDLNDEEIKAIIDYMSHAFRKTK